MISGRSVNVSVTGVIGAMVAGGELEEVNRRLTAATMVLINAGSRVGEALLAARAAQLRVAAERSREQARRVRAQVATARRNDSLVWRAASRRSWWRHASAHDVARAWQAAHTWHQVDPHAAQALDHIREQLARRGVDVQPGSGQPADAHWLATALELADSEQQIGDRHQLVALAFEHTDADRDRFAAVVRREWDPQTADSVIGNQAWPALAYRLHELEFLGGDLPAVLDAVSLDGARNPAALAEWQVENTINHLLVVSHSATELTAAAAEALASVDQQPARHAALNYAATRLTIAQRQLDQAGVEPEIRTRMQAHVQQLGELLDELPGSADVVATVAVHEPAMLRLLRDGPLGELAERRSELSTLAEAAKPTTGPVSGAGGRLDTAAAARVYRSPGPMSIKDLLAAAHPSSTQQAIGSAQQPRQPAASPKRSRSTARGHSR